MAADFLNQHQIEIPALLDNIDDKTSNDYASLPDRMFLISIDGKIAMAGDRGPRGFRPDLLETAIKKELKKTTTLPVPEASPSP